MIRLFVLVFALLYGVDVMAISEGLVAGYNQGNAHYRKGEYDAAIVAYKQVLAQGLENSDVFYNLGNAYYKAGQLGRAILAYERALKLKPDDEDIRTNLRFVNAQKLDKDPEDDANVLTRFLRAIYIFFSINVLTIVLSICVFAGCALGIGWVFVPLRKWLWIGALIVVGAGMICSGSMLGLKIYQADISQAIVLSSEVVARSGPGEDFLQVFTLHEGTKVVIERREGEWFLVRLTSGVGGWLRAQSLEGI